jgi:hypothetical protein
MKTKQTIVLMAIGILVGCSNPGGGNPPPPPSPPIEINSVTELNAINTSAENLSGNYKLMANITVTVPIGNVGGDMIPFSGDFDGNGYTVTLNITSGISVSGGTYPGTYAGLFAGLSGTVHDLTVIGTINITGATLDLYAGGVAGATLPGAAVSNVSSSVDVSASGSGDVYAGGILGASQSAVSNVYATGNISATTSGTKEAYAGGIAGTVTPTGAVSYAYATGQVSATGTGTGNGVGTGKITLGAGGIVGGSNGAPVRYTVALNSGVSVIDSTPPSYNKCSYRITSTSGGTVTGGPNYGKADLGPTGGSYPIDKGDDDQDGVDVTVTGGPPSAYTAPNEAWWTDYGFSGADWTTVWEWDTATGLPKLR